MDTVMKKVLEMAAENQVSQVMIVGQHQALDLARVLAAAVTEAAANPGAATLILALTQEVNQSLNQTHPERTRFKQNHQKSTEPSFGNLAPVFWLSRDLQCLGSSHSRPSSSAQLHLIVDPKKTRPAVKTPTTRPAVPRGRSTMMKTGRCLGPDLHLSLVQTQNLKKSEIKAAATGQSPTTSRKTKSEAESLRIDLSQKMGKKFLDKKRDRLIHLRMKMMKIMIMINEALAAKPPSM